jgi:peroxiredoxin
VAQLRREKNRFDQAGAQVVLVGMGTPEQSAAFARQLDVPFPILSDPRQELYRAFELRRMSALGFFSPTVALKGVAAMVQGHGVGLPQGDIRQLPGVFVIDAAGQIVYSHYATDPADQPNAETILKALSRAA